jgi:predicted TIM-barrel fold metal-dependent hydrolase
MTIDADGHIMLPADIWDKYFERGPMYDRRPRRVPDNFGRTRLMVDGEFLPRRHGRWRGSGVGDAPERRRPGGRDPLERLKDMDSEGIDIAVNFPSGILSLPQVIDAPMALAMTRAYHDWLGEYCAAAPKRLKGVAVVAAQDIPAGVAELERCVKDYGFVGAFVAPNFQGLNLDEPMFYPLWDACQRLDVPALVHSGPGANAAGTERFDNFFYVHSVQFPFENMIALMTMIGGGVFDQFPALRVAYLESGCGWVPYWMERLDDQAKLEKFDVPLLPRRLAKRPSEYVKTRCFFSCEPGEESIPWVAQQIGAGRLVFASDYSHFDSKFPDTVRLVRETPGLSAESADLILRDNSLALFGSRLVD